VAVEENGPAQKAGLTERDVIVGFEGHPVENMDDLHRLLSSGEPGKVASLSVIRRSIQLDLRIIPEENPRTPH